jgi:hypothetical protein
VIDSIAILSDETLEKGMRSCLKAWARARPDELAATRRYMDKVKDQQANHHGVAGLSEQGGLLNWGIIPGTVYNLITAYLGPGWDADNRALTAFFKEFRLGCVNEHTEANQERPHYH